MGAQAFQPVGGTAGGEIPEMGSEIGGTKAADVPLPAGEGDKKAMVFTEEQIEAPIGAVFLVRVWPFCRWRAELHWGYRCWP